MTDTTPAPRRLCPACSRTYGALIRPECPICHGVGVITLGAAALHQHPAPVVARAVELAILAAAAAALDTLPITGRAEQLEAAVDELRLAGVIAAPEQRHTGDVFTRNPPTGEAEAAAHLILATLGTEVPTAALALHHAARRPLTRARARHGDPFPSLSADGWPDPIAQVTDPVDALGPSGTRLEGERRANEHAAHVLAEAAHVAAHRKTGGRP